MSKIWVKSAWGSDDPTKAAFLFLHANALAEAGHDVQIFLLGEAVSLMRTPVADALVPGRWSGCRAAVWSACGWWRCQLRDGNHTCDR
jgi:hypothetical protein